MTSSQKFHMEAPPNWQATIDNIRKVRTKYPAPVDSMGCAHAHDRRDKDKNQRFQVLTSLMLSSQTKDPITWAASSKLKEAGLGNVRGILGASEKDIEELIYPVGFYRRKAVYLKKVAEILAKDYNCDIPDKIKDLCKLPGVGPKMAHLCMSEAWNVVSGIGVDTHVHRIAGRLAWVPPNGIKTPEDTRQALESWLPRELWREINHMLVGFGQTICTPLRPKCGECYNNSICPSSNLKKGIEVDRKAKVEIKQEFRDEQLFDEEDRCGPKVKIKAEPVEITSTILEAGQQIITAAAATAATAATKKPTKAAALDKKTRKELIIDHPASRESKANKKIKLEPVMEAKPEIETEAKPKPEPEMESDSAGQILSTSIQEATEMVNKAIEVVGAMAELAKSRPTTRSRTRQVNANIEQAT